MASRASTIFTGIVASMMSLMIDRSLFMSDGLR
jgi:hypothetical protein